MVCRKNEYLYSRNSEFTLKKSDYCFMPINDFIWNFHFPYHRAAFLSILQLENDFREVVSENSGMTHHIFFAFIIINKLEF